MNPLILAVQATYKTIDIAILEKNGDHLEYLGNHKAEIKASAALIPEIDKLLKSYQVKISDLSAIAVDQGPGAFTSLRVAIATVNGISTASNIALIGIDGLDALALQTKSSLKKSDLIISVLNAYNNELYYGIYHNREHTLNEAPELAAQKGYKKIDLLLEQIKTDYPDQSIMFNGNGCPFIESKLESYFGDKASIAKSYLEQASASTIGRMAYEKFLKNEGLVSKLLPLYLKDQSYVLRPQ